MVNKQPNKRRKSRHHWQKNVKNGERITVIAHKRTIVSILCDREVHISVDKPRPDIQN